jgi:hypothetical protein
MLRLLRFLLGVLLLVIGGALVARYGAATAQSLMHTHEGLTLANLYGVAVGMAGLGASADLLGLHRSASRSPAPPPTREAWKGSFADMNQASEKMGKER